MLQGLIHGWFRIRRNLLAIARTEKTPERQVMRQGAPHIFFLYQIFKEIWPAALWGADE